MNQLKHLTDAELTTQLMLRNDLTDLEYELIGRLQAAGDAMHAMETEIEGLLTAQEIADGADA